MPGLEVDGRGQSRVASLLGLQITRNDNGDPPKLRYKGKVIKQSIIGSV